MSDERGGFASFTRAVVRLRWVVLIGWVVAGGAAWLYLPGLPSASAGAFASAIPDNAKVLQVQERAIREFGLPVLSRTAVVLRDPHGLSLREQGHVVAVAARALKGGLPGFSSVLAALPVTNIAGLVPSSSERGTTAVTYLFFAPGTSTGDRFSLAQRYATTFFQRPAGGELGVTGPTIAEQAQGGLISHALSTVELGAIAVVLLVVGFRFRSVVAPVITLCGAGIAYLVAVHVVGWLGQRFGVEVPGSLEPLLVVLLVGVMTDYGVFLLSGYRRALRTGARPRAAICQAGAATIPIVVVAGIAVAAGTASLLAARLSLFRRLGPGMAITVLVTMVVAITIIPALIAVLGRFALWPSRRGQQRNADAGEESASPQGVRAALLRRLVRRPVAAGLLLVGGGALIAAALPLAGFATGINLIADLPNSAGPARALQAASAGFAAGITAPTELIVHAPGIAHRRDAVTGLQHKLSRQPGVAGVIGPVQQPLPVQVGAVYAPSGNAVRYLVIFSERPYGARAINRLSALERALPGLLDQAGLRNVSASWTGDTVISKLLVDLSRGDLLRVGAVALAVLLLIMIGFLRALVAPIVLLLASAGAVAATLGVTLWLFPRLTDVGGPTFYLPIAVAVLLISFGSDYNIFLVGRIWERGSEQSIDTAIVEGATYAARAIGVAGLALAATFAMLALVPLNVFRQFSFAMVLGIMLDTFFVRSYLVPAALALLGRWASWPSHRLGKRA